MGLLLQGLAETTSAISGDIAGTVSNSIMGDFSWLIIGIALVVATALVLFFLKNVIVNTVLGVIGWVLVTWVFGLSLPFWPSLLVSVLFGPAGLGAIVVLGFLGIV